MFLLVGCANIALHRPGFATLLVIKAGCLIGGPDPRGTLGSINHAPIFTLRVRNLSTLKGHNTVTRIFIIDRHIVPHLATGRAGKAPPGTVGGNRGPLHEPVHDVDIVNGLLHNLVSRKPDKVHPVVELILGIAHPRFPRSIPNTGCAIPRGSRNHVANLACVDPPHRLHVILLTAVLRTGDNCSSLFARCTIRFQTDTIAGRIDAGRLLRKDMFARCSRLGNMVGTKTGRGRQQHKINI